jgi:hypothetical protein
MSALFVVYRDPLDAIHRTNSPINGRAMALVKLLGEGSRVDIFAPPVSELPFQPRLDSLGIDYVAQKPRDYWCWDACAIMLGMHFRIRTLPSGAALSTCALAGVIYQADCCSEPFDTQSCDAGGAWPHQAYDQLRIHYAPDYPPESVTRLPIEQVRSELVTHRRPIQVLYKWIGQDGTQLGAHVALIVGIWSDGDLEVLDPLFGPEPKVSYDFVSRARGAGRWEGTYYELAYPIPSGKSGEM